MLGTITIDGDPGIVTIKWAGTDVTTETGTITGVDQCDGMVTVDGTVTVLGTGTTTVII